MGAREKKIVAAQCAAFKDWLDSAAPEKIESQTAERAHRSYGLPIENARRMLAAARRRINA